MVEVIPDVNLSFKEYQASLQQNPSNIFYQRVASRNVSNQQCSHTVSSPNKRGYLLSDPKIEWQFTFTRVDTANATFVPGTVALPYVAGRDLISLKPVLPVANSMSSITTSINGSTNTIAQPRHFMECMSMMHVSREEALKHYESGYPARMGGTINQNFPSITWSYNERDHTMEDQYYDFASRQLRGATSTSAATTFFDNGERAEFGGTIVVTEPIISPPFDCYAKVDKSSMPEWSPWKWMSPSIPNIDRLDIDIQFTKLDASLMYYFYGKSSANVRPPAMTIAADGVVANLLLYWTITPTSTSIPRSLDIQSYNVREFQDPAGVVAVADNVPRDDTSSLIQLNSVPSLILTHLERDKDNPDYQPVACASQSNLDNAAQADVRDGGAIHNWDNYGEINNITYQLGDRPNVISASFSQRELYDLTVKNSKDFPYTFDDWRGRKRPLYNNGLFTAGTDVQQGRQGFAANWASYPCKGMVAVTGADIANKTSTGVFSSNSLQIIVNWRPHSGFAGTAPGNNIYRLYNHLLFGKEFMRIETDKAQFQSQSLDEATARRLTDPPLGSQMMPVSLPASVADLASGGALTVGGALGVGGALAPLRNRGVSAIGSRL